MRIVARLQAPVTDLDLRAGVRVSATVWPQRLSWLLVAALPPLLAVPQLGEWMFFDDAVYATVAREMLRGGTIYVDAFDHKPPVIHLVYAALLWLGADTEALRFALFAGLGVTAVLMRFIARQFFDDRVAYWVALTFGGSTALVLLSDNGSSEQLMLLPLTASFLAHLVAVREGRLRFLVLAGGLGALAVWTKPLAAFNLGALVALLFVCPAQLRGTPWAWRVGALALGAGAVSAGFVAWLAIAVGPFAFEALVSFNQAYGGLVTPAQRVSNLLQLPPFLLIGFGPLAPLVVLGGWRLMRAGNARSERPVVIGVWGVASMLGALSPGFLFGQYFLHLLPVAALCAGVSYEWLALAERRRLMLAVLAAVCVLAAVPTLVSLANYPPRTGPEGMQEFTAALRDAGGTDDRLFVHGRLPQAYWVSGMRPANRYLFHTVFMARPDLWPSVVAELRADPPGVILEDRRPPQPGHPLSVTVSSPEYEAWRDERYEVLRSLDAVTVYRLRR